MNEFHFLRPWWWLAWPLMIAFAGWWWRRAPRAGAWSAVCDAHLLPALLAAGAPARRRHWTLATIMAAGTLLIAALAGPVWQRAPQAVWRAQAAQVILLSLSSSMDANDVAPSRVARARLKILDLLQRVRDEQVALMVYAGSAHIVAPLTDDAKTVANLVPVLATDLLPDGGDRLDLALSEALAMLHRQAISHGHVILVTDDAGDSAALTQANYLRAAGHRLSVLAVGTAQGAPIPRAGGGFVKNLQGNILMPRLDEARMKDLANAGGGLFVHLRVDDSDVDALASALEPATQHTAREGESRSADVWKEEGHWLLLAVIPVALFGFRRGALAMVLLTTLAAPRQSHAWEWNNLWLRRDQQAQQLLNDHQHNAAAALFDDAAWRGVARYRAGNFNEAVRDFARQEDAESHYNRGNALAHAGQIEDAIAAYEQSLRLQPDHADAKFNLEILKKAKQQKDSAQRPGEQKQNQPQGGGGQQPDNGQPADAHSPRDGAQSPKQRGGARNDPSPASNSPEGQHPRDQHAARPQADNARNDAESQPQPATARDAESEEDEQQRYLSQQLRRVPDDPGGFLRQKFLREQRRRQLQGGSQ